jgi:uncharacterized membrane protein YeaQ/YmgE (transglycosylase-associated protein family)
LQIREGVQSTHHLAESPSGTPVAPDVAVEVGFISNGATAMSILLWILVGLVAGVLASFVMGGIGYGIIGDIVVGIVGAFLGGWLFSKLGVSSPFGGLAGTIFVAFVGAVVLLLILRLLRRPRTW